MRLNTLLTADQRRELEALPPLAADRSSTPIWRSHGFFSHAPASLRRPSERTGRMHLNRPRESILNGVWA